MKKNNILKIQFLLVFSLFLTTVNAQYANVETIVGNGTDYGDSVNAVDSDAFLPVGLVVDIAGNIYFTELTNCVVRKIDVNGVVTRIAGSVADCGDAGDGGQAVSSELNFPAGLAVDSQDNLYIADRDNNKIRKIDTNGVITTVAGNGNEGFSGDGGLATNASLNQPRSIAVDQNGNLYISDWQNDRIRKVDTNGIITTVAGTGEYGFSGDGGNATLAKLKSPSGIALDTNGNIYITTNSDRVRKIDTNGIITTIAGVDSFNNFSGDGGLATEAQFNKPTNLAIAANGDLYITDNYNHRIRYIDSNGIINTVVGTGRTGFSGGGFNGDGNIGTETLLKQPSGITFDGVGNLLIADYRNDRIRKLNKATLSNENFKLDNTTLYPNPISQGEKLNISSKNLVSEIIVYNSIGQQVFKTNPKSNTYQLNLSNLNSGIYFVNIKNDKNDTGSYKIVKE